MPKEDTQWKPGQSGNPKGRPPGVPALRDAMMKLLSENADEFADKFAAMLREGDSTAWQLMMKRAYPEPKTEVDVTTDGESVRFTWRPPEKPRQKPKKKAPRKKAPAKKASS